MIPLLFAILATLFIVMSIALYIRMRLAHSKWVFVPGIIVDYREAVQFGESIHYPIYQYEINGHVYRSTSAIGSDPPSLPTGAKVRVLVDPVDNAKSVIMHWDRYLAPLSSLLFGLLFYFASLIP